MIQLLGSLSHAAVQALLKYFQAVTGTELVLGVVASIQTLGKKINLHPRLHCLVTDGGEDSEGKFHHLAEFEDSLLAVFFKREVFALLLRKELISEEMVEKIAGWRHCGFNVHSGVRAQTKKEAERVGKYMIRPLLALERLSFMIFSFAPMETPMPFPALLSRPKAFQLALCYFHLI